MTTVGEARRGLRSFSMAFGLMWATIALMAGLASSSYVRLTGDPANAGLPLGVFFVASAVGSALGGRACDAWGRRPIMSYAFVLAAAGYLAVGLGAAMQLPAVFLGGLAVAGLGTGVTILLRVAAAELFPPDRRGRAVAWLHASATVGAVAGPLFLLLAEPLRMLLDWNSLERFWFFVPFPLVLAAWLTVRSPESSQIAAEIETGSTHTHLSDPGRWTASWGLVILGLLTLVLVHSAMSAVMGVTGAAMNPDGEALVVVGIVMAVHFFGMFAFSLVGGRLADAAGRRTTILLGLALLLAGALLFAVAGPVWVFTLALFLIGLGWSFAYIGSTVLITNATSLVHRARVMGIANFGDTLLAAGAMVLSGWWYAGYGTMGVGVFAAFLVLPPVVLNLLLREPRTGGYRSEAASGA